MWEEVSQLPVPLSNKVPPTLVAAFTVTVDKKHQVSKMKLRLTVFWHSRKAKRMGTLLVLEGLFWNSECEEPLQSIQSCSVLFRPRKAHTLKNWTLCFSCWRPRTGHQRTHIFWPVFAKKCSTTGEAMQWSEIIETLLLCWIMIIVMPKR